VVTRDKKKNKFSLKEEKKKRINVNSKLKKYGRVEEM